MLISLLHTCLVIAAVWADIIENDKNDLHARLPDPLQLTNFDSALADGYHLVEFFSPYCHHCTALLPIWVDFYENYQEENKNSKSKINIHQVDCVSSGDLCDREGIQYYPVIRFYGPGGKLLGSMTNNHRTIDTIGEFVNEQHNLWSDDEPFENNLNPLFSFNHQLDSNQMLSIISGINIEKPTLVSFWPTDDKDFDEETFQNNHKDSHLFANYPFCYNFRNFWNIALKRLENMIKSDELSLNFFNCKSNAEICEKLGFKELTKSHPDEYVTPKIILFLPTNEGGNAIKYNSKNDEYMQLNKVVIHFTHWIEKVTSSFKFEDKKFNEIENFIGASKTLELSGRISEYKSFSRIGFVWVNDPKIEVDEDYYLTKYLLQDVADLDGDIFLMRTTDIEGVQNFLMDQEKYLADSYINSVVSPPSENAKDDPIIEDKSIFNEELFIARTHTSYPFILCVKQGSLISPVYNSFQSNEIRDYNKVSNFIKSNSLPIISHLTLDNLNEIFPPVRNSNIHGKNEKIVITLTDFSPKQFFDVEFFMSYVYHKFTYLLNSFNFDKVKDERKIKKEHVAKLKANDADTTDIIQVLKEPIASAFQQVDNKVHMVYADYDEFSQIVSKSGWTGLSASNYKVGDSIIVNRFANSFWDNTETLDVGGNTDKYAQLTYKMPFETTEILNGATWGSIQWKGKTLTLKWWFWIVTLYVVLIFTAYVAYKLWKKIDAKSKNQVILPLSSAHTDSGKLFGVGGTALSKNLFGSTGLRGLGILGMEKGDGKND